MNLHLRSTAGAELRLTTSLALAESALRLTPAIAATETLTIDDEIRLGGYTIVEIVLL